MIGGIEVVVVWKDEIEARMRLLHDGDDGKTGAPIGVIALSGFVFLYLLFSCAFICG